MATRRKPILNWDAAPDDSGNVFPQSFAVLATNDVWKRDVYVFQDTSTRIGLHGGFAVPKGYVDTANLVVVFTAVPTAGAMEWDFDYRAVGGIDSESLDQSGNQESVNGSGSAPSATLERMEISIALTDGNLAVDDEVEFTLFRDGTDAGDTMSGSAILFNLLFEYNDA